MAIIQPLQQVFPTIYMTTSCGGRLVNSCTVANIACKSSAMLVSLILLDFLNLFFFGSQLLPCFLCSHPILFQGLCEFFQIPKNKKISMKCKCGFWLYVGMLSTPVSRNLINPISAIFGKMFCGQRLQATSRIRYYGGKYTQVQILRTATSRLL